MIKVCHMTSAHPAEDVRIFHKECTSLAKAGYETYLVAQGGSYEKNGVNIVGVGQPHGGRLSRMTTFAKKVYKAALELDADIYHFHDPELLPYGLELKKKGKIVIFDSHENTVEQIKEKEWIPNILRMPMYFIFDKYQKYACSKLDIVVSVTPHTCEYFKRINLKTYMVTNYPIFNEEYTSPTFKNRRIGFAGGISKQWNHENIIKAMESIEDIKYELCGFGSDEYLEKLKKLSEWEKVNFYGKIPHTEVSKLLSGCSVGLAVVSYNRNVGGKLGTLGNTKIFEEMMAGLPIICTDFILWREIVNKYDCGICVNPENIDEIANAIKYLLDNPDEAKRMGENGRRAVEEEFNWGVEEKKLLSLYEDILQN